MGEVARREQLVKDVVRLRRAERIPAAAADVAEVRARLEDAIGPTVSRALAARLLGVSQTALDRWISAGEIATVITPSGRREVPRQFVIDLIESIEELERRGLQRHRLAAALRRRRPEPDALPGALSPESGAHGDRPGPHDHRTAERRALAYHQAVAARLDDRLIREARERLSRWRRTDAMHPAYAERWEEVLARPPEEIARIITSEGPDARDLRQSSPFAGSLHEDERRRIIEAVR